ncbi:hypothetical protein PVAP13_6KG166836 [Panicum virgatum]|uniref:Uncharacterized protein n=1 Tax=Panicum virgatum TaxID=38727 RepID=A0A8T0RDV7_PANVG|nr:hypothetical protein PVAP13_6KG166836 [Panicum virgatum]
MEKEAFLVITCSLVKQGSYTLVWVLQPPASTERSFTIRTNSFELTLPVIDAMVSVGGPLLYEPKTIKMIYIVIAFVAATAAPALWRRIVDTVVIYLRLTMPQLPEFIVCLKTYKHPRIPERLIPLQWLWLTFARNIKLCITQGTIVWTIVFIVCLPEAKDLMKSRAYTSFKIQLVPPCS